MARPRGSLKRKAIWAFRRRVNEALSNVDDLTGVPESQRARLRPKVCKSTCRTRAANNYIAQIMMPVIFGLLILSIVALAIAATAWMQYWSQGSGSEFLGLGIVFGLILMNAIVAYVQNFSGRYRGSRVIYHFFNLGVFAYISSLLTYSIVKESWVVYIIGASIAPNGYLIATRVIATLRGRLMSRRSTRPESLYDAVALLMLDTAALVSRERRNWQSGKVSRRIVARIEDLARACERSIALRSRIGRWHADVFSETAVEALRVAHVVREHKKMIACASKAGDFDDVARSLANGVEALLESNRGKLLENAPDAILKDRLKVLVRHVFPVVILVVAAIILPLVPTISAQDKLADSVRLTLIVAAVLALVAPRNESSTRILDLLGKTMPSK